MGLIWRCPDSVQRGSQVDCKVPLYRPGKTIFEVGTCTAKLGIEREIVYGLDRVPKNLE